MNCPCSSSGKAFISGACQSSGDTLFSGIEKPSDTAAEVNKTWFRITITMINPNKTGNHDSRINCIVDLLIRKFKITNYPHEEFMLIKKILSFCLLHGWYVYFYTRIV